jgi:hypothetical protein
MTAPVRYIERALNPEGRNIEVEVFTPSTWGAPGQPLYHYVRYPDLTGLGIPGREYIISDEQLNRHFDMAPNQRIRVQAWGGVFQRPLKAQVELDEKLEAMGGTDG